MRRASPRWRSPRCWRRRGSSLEVHRRLDRQTERQELPIFQSVIDDDLHRYPAHDLHEVAGRVLGGKCRKARTAAALNALDVAVQVQLGVSVDLDVDELSHAHAIELRLLEVRYDPDFACDQVEHLLAGCCVRAEI